MRRNRASHSRVSTHTSQSSVFYLALALGNFADIMWAELGARQDFVARASLQLCSQKLMNMSCSPKSGPNKASNVRVSLAEQRSWRRAVSRRKV